jgi:hypothetical protein
LPPGSVGGLAADKPARYWTSGPGFGNTGSVPSTVAQLLKPAMFALQIFGKLSMLVKRFAWSQNRERDQKLSRFAFDAAVI